VTEFLYRYIVTVKAALNVPYYQNKQYYDFCHKDVELSLSDIVYIDQSVIRAIGDPHNKEQPALLRINSSVRLK